MIANRSRALDALGDPTRRSIFEALASGAMPVGVLARRVPVSRPAVSQHLRVLKAAGLVIDRPSGARRLYEVDPAGVAELRTWLRSDSGRWRSARSRQRRKTQEDTT